MKKITFISLGLLLFSVFLFPSLYAELTPMPYFCGFEDENENANWVFVSPEGSLNSWEIGTSEKLSGDYGLYVSPDGGITAGNNDTKNFFCVYRVFEFEAGEVYEVSFNWKNPGYGKGELYVCVIPDEVELSPMQSLTDIPPAWLEAYRRLGDSMLTGTSLWQQMVFTVAAASEPCKLLFYWQNSSESVHPSGKTVPAGCIDNIQIVKKYDCPQPANLEYKHIDSSTGKFIWNGQGDEYEIIYKGIYDSDWDTIYANNNLEINIDPLQAGAYMAAIRGICGNDTSLWNYNMNIFVSNTSDKCIDYLDLAGDHIRTYYGNFDNPYMYMGLIDYGFSSRVSRHTVHYLTDEYDPRTNYKLKTTPPDNMPSVRLGNWDVGAEAEAIEYTYQVGNDVSVLLIKYAIVLEDPYHAEYHQPSFSLEIFDEMGNIIDALCGNVNFMADRNADGWEIAQPSGYQEVIFKNWTSIGLNLSHYVGQTITIRITTKDCAQTGHFGYAYFALDCMNTSINAIGCGDNTFASISAPEGFRYKWYPKGHPEYMELPYYNDTLQTFRPSDDLDQFGIYVCQVISMENPDCIFEIEANLDPRDVYTDFNYAITLKNPESKVVFENNSYTETRINKERGKVEYYEWDFGDGRTSNEESPTVYFEPGEYDVKLYASIADDLCYDEKTVHLVVPDYDKCINFTNLNDADVVTAGHGTYNGNATAHIGVIDYGYESSYSRHTVHYVPDETDSRTNGLLKTVPSGEYASVRLGNWEAKNESQSLTYTITVEETNPIFLIKYAVVFENLNHIENEDSFNTTRFILRITDESGHSLDDGFNITYFASDLLGWNTINNTAHKYPVIWKDWTMIAINLRDYIGENVKIYFETSDCFPAPESGCFGYAYFTLDCMNDVLEIQQASDGSYYYDAPDGFDNYEWRNSKNEILSNEQRLYFNTDFQQNQKNSLRSVIQEPADFTSFTCYTYSETNEDNKLRFVTPSLLTYDLGFASTIYQEDCVAKVDFTNETILEVLGEPSSNLNEINFAWNFGNETTSREVHPESIDFDSHGEYIITLYVLSNSGDTIETTEKTITIPDFWTYRDTIEILSPEEFPKHYNDSIFTADFEDGEYIFELQTEEGCDSTIYLYFKKSYTITNLETHTVNKIQLYPNPVNKNGTVEILADFNDSDKNGLAVEIFDLQGKSILRYRPDTYPVRVDLKNIDKGMYLIKVTSGTKKEFSTKFLIN